MSLSSIKNCFKGKRSPPNASCTLAAVIFSNIYHKLNDTNQGAESCIDENWTASGDVFEFEIENQKEKKEKYIIKVCLIGETMIVNIMEMNKEESLKFVEVCIQNYIDVASFSAENPFDSLILSKYQSLYDITAALVIKENQKEKETQTQKEKQKETEKEREKERERERERERGERERETRNREMPQNSRLDGRRSDDYYGSTNPYSIGRSDLDPFSSSSGNGMFAGPNHPMFGPPRVPIGGMPGGVPPGARFDPFGPFVPNVPNNNPNSRRGPAPLHPWEPDNDEFKML